MSYCPSGLFDFLANGTGGNIERRELRLLPFTTLRRSLGAIMLRLRETDDPGTVQVSDSVRVHLSDWLTAPVPFDQRLFEWAYALGDPARIEAQWGADIQRLHDAALDAVHELLQIENPARVEIREMVRRLSRDGRSWRIYCHPRARVHFESIGEEVGVSAESFLHSAIDYGQAAPFDVLLKCGPLRARGWGSAPDALLSAPRFRTLVQFVWAGSADEDGFGRDPVANASGALAGNPHVSNSARWWTRHVIQIGAPHPSVTEPDVDIDELRVFHQFNSGASLRPAVLLDLGDNHGVLLPPNAQVPSLDPTAGEDDSAVGFRIPGETLVRGMFLIRAQLGELDLGGVKAADGVYSRIWKQRLNDALLADSSGLTLRLKTAGLNLQHLSSSLRRWCKAPTTVIHAPQQKRHFEILIGVLGVDHERLISAGRRQLPWWQYAWSEIAHSRGEAIADGTQKQEITYDELLHLLTDALPELCGYAQALQSFRYVIPNGRSLCGVVNFHLVKAIEDGFRVPDYALKEITELDAVEQWRA